MAPIRERRPSTLRSHLGWRRVRSEKGHDDQFPPPSLSDRCQLGEATFARMGGKEEHAPFPAVRGPGVRRLSSAERGPPGLTGLDGPEITTTQPAPLAAPQFAAPSAASMTAPRAEQAKQ